MESDVKCNEGCALVHLSEAGQTDRLGDRGRMNKFWSSRELKLRPLTYSKISRQTKTRLLCVLNQLVRLTHQKINPMSYLKS